MQSEKFLKYKRILIPVMFILMVIVGGSVFPIINLNPDNPVDLGILMKFIVVFLFFYAFVGFGAFEAVCFKNWNFIKFLCFNIILGTTGLIFRYLLEFGEVSNTYNFTVGNVVLHLVLVVELTTISAFMKKRKMNIES